MSAGRGKGDPMAGLLSNLGGIDPNLFNKPTMGQLKNKQQSPAVPPKPVTQMKPDTIAAVGSPVRSEAGPSDSSSSQRSNATRTNPGRSGAVADDLDSFFGSAKASAAPSNAGSYAPSPANMASPAASLDHPDSQQDADFFGNFSTAPKPAAKPSAAPVQQAQHQQAAVDPFDLFGEGSTISAPAAVAGHPASADDGLFGDVQGNQGSVSHAQNQAASAPPNPTRGTPEAQRHDLLPSRSPQSSTSKGQPPQSQGRSALPRRSSSFTTAGSPDSRSSPPDAFATDRRTGSSSSRANPSSALGKGSSSSLGSSRQHGSSSSLDTTDAVRGSPVPSQSPLSSVGRPQRTPSLRTRRSPDDGRGSRKGPLEEGASGPDVASGGRHPDPYMHEDPYVNGGQSSRQQGSGNVEQTAKQWLTGGQKWLKSAGKKLATVAKESASEIQKRLETVDVKMQKGKGMRVGDDGEEVPAYYHQWAAKIQDMSPARQADVLDQLGEEDRLIVQRILDHAVVQRSNDSALSGMSHSQRSHARPVSPSGSDSSPPPPPYPGTAGNPRTGKSQPATRSASPQAERAGESRMPAQSDQGRRSADDESFRSHSEVQQKPKTAADLGIFDFDSQSSAEIEEPRFESRAAESRVAEAEPVRPAPQRAPAQTQQPQQRPQQPAPVEADFLGFGSSQEAAEEAFMPESPTAESSQSFAAETSQSPYPPPPGPQAATPDGLADFFSAPAAAPSSSSGARAQSSTAHIDDMFSAGPRPSAPAPKPAAAASQPQRGRGQSQGPVGPGGRSPGSAAVPKPVPKAAPTSMIDFGDEAKLLAENPDLYKGLEEVAGEPAYRKELREKRLREMHQRMQQQLAEKLARDAAESSEKEEKVDLRGRIVKPKIDAWTQGKKDNIRALLSTLHTVLWEGSGWNPPGMTDLVETGKVKKQYMKANLIIHPDKVKQKGGTVEQIVIADMAFDVLKTAWAKFESGELRK